MNEAASLHFEVLSGPYAGLSGKAAVGTSLIGSGLDADMVFVEQGLEPHHLRITLVGNSIELEALANVSTPEGEGDIAAGERVVLFFPPSFVRAPCLFAGRCRMRLRLGRSASRAFGSQLSPSCSSAFLA